MPAVRERLFPGGLRKQNAALSRGVSINVWYRGGRLADAPHPATARPASGDVRPHPSSRARRLRMADRRRGRARDATPAIIDPAGGQQPVYSEDRSIRAVFNGEIYNYRDLRRRLEAKGHRFRSNADTEVIPHLWEEYGPDFVQRLNGMFAIALHDARANRFVLVRDHLGIKPVFYALDDERLVFGSEIKALLASGLVERELDVDALGEFIGWEYVPAPRTLFRDIRKLEPGHLLECNLATGIARCHCWDVPLAPAKEPQDSPTRAGRSWSTPRLGAR